MLKRLLLKNNTRSDVRFLDAERYRTLYALSVFSAAKRLVKAQPDSSPGFAYSSLTKPASDIGILDRHGTRSESATISLFRACSGEPLYSGIDAEIDQPIYLEPANDRSDEARARGYSPQLNGLECKGGFNLSFIEPEENQKNAHSLPGTPCKPLRENELCEYSLGVFSDSKMYSALIQKELSRYCLDIRHFNHPKTFIEARQPFFDKISTWILFLSDDCDERFIEHFVGRYCDKPTLFLCPKMTRKNATEQIREFIDCYRLEKQSQQAAPELELN